MEKGDYVGHSYYGKGTVVQTIGFSYVVVDFGYPFSIRTLNTNEVHEISVLPQAA